MRQACRLRAHVALCGKTLLTMELGIYTHLPYCPSRCPYCDFFAQPFAAAQARKLTSALHRHLAIMAPLSHGRILDHVYLGGGTPSMWPVEVLGGLLEEMNRLLGIRPGAEMTLEANPGTLSPGKLLWLRRAGFNRLSLGAQSFDPGLLKALGRRHSAEDTRRAMDQARKAGFANLNLDLIYGLPGQSLEQAKNDIQTALDLEPDHLSLYELTLDPQTPFGQRYQKGRWPLPGERELFAMEQSARGMIAASGLNRYEVSNFAHAGKECRHNLSTWQGGDYLALGPGAHGHGRGSRWGLVENVAAYCTEIGRGQEPLALKEDLSPQDQARERIMLGLRTRLGVDMAALAQILGQDPAQLWPEPLVRLKVWGWARLERGRLRPTDAGLDMADTAAAMFF